MIELESSPDQSVVHAAPDELFQSQASYPQIARRGEKGQRFSKAFSCSYSENTNETSFFFASVRCGELVGLSCGHARTNMGSEGLESEDLDLS
jgi:hypothetical protein